MIILLHKNKLHLLFIFFCVCVLLFSSAKKSLEKSVRPTSVLKLFLWVPDFLIKLTVLLWFISWGFHCQLIAPYISFLCLFPAIFPTLTNKDTIAFLQNRALLQWSLTIDLVYWFWLIETFLLTFIFNLQKYVSNLKISSFYILI